MAKSVVESALRLPLSLDNYGNIVMTSNQNKIWADRVRSAIGTIRGERVMLPAYGSKISDSLFAGQTETEQVIKREISSVFNLYLPLLTLDEVEVISTNDVGSDGTMTANITYTLPNLTQVTTAVGIVTINGNYPPYEENV